MRQRYKEAIKRFLHVLSGTDEVLFVSSVRTHALEKVSKAVAFINTEGIQRLQQVLARKYPQLPYSLLQIHLDYPDADSERHLILKEPLAKLPNVIVGQATIIRTWRNRRNGWYGIAKSWEQNFHALGLTK